MNSGRNAAARPCSSCRWSGPAFIATERCLDLAVLLLEDLQVFPSRMRAQPGRHAGRHAGRTLHDGACAAARSLTGARPGARGLPRSERANVPLNPSGGNSSGSRGAFRTLNCRRWRIRPPYLGSADASVCRGAAAGQFGHSEAAMVSNRSLIAWVRGL